MFILIPFPPKHIISEKNPQFCVCTKFPLRVINSRGGSF